MTCVNKGTSTAPIFIDRCSASVILKLFVRLIFEQIRVPTKQIHQEATATLVCWQVDEGKRQGNSSPEPAVKNLEKGGVIVWCRAGWESGARGRAS